MNAPALLGRAERYYPLPDLAGKSVVVTGSSGSVGRVLVTACRELGAAVYPWDLPTHDVTRRAISRSLKELRPDVVFHLAADKHAPAGEEHPWTTQHVNIEGTGRVLQGCGRRTRVIVPSTCKACDPETVYGASKLVAERLTLDAHQTVGRLYNIIESAGNVFELWRDQLETEGRIRVTACHRYFIGMREAATFLLSLIEAEPGRYSPYPGQPVQMYDMARRWLALERPDKDPDPLLEMVDRRRGDRQQEPLWARAELGTADAHGRIVITNEHDRDRQPIFA